MARHEKRPRKSDRTKAAILAAARAQFAAQGYEGTTMRGIAEVVGVDAALIVHYFGRKDDLFALAAEIELVDIAAIDAEDGPIGARAVRYFLRMWEGEAAIPALPVLLRTAASNPLAAERMRALFAGHVTDMLSRLAGRPVDTARAGLVASQMLGFAYCRYILRLPAIAEMSEEAAVAALAETVQRHLD